MARAEDVYPYVATMDIMHGTICAFRAGDPVPDSTVEEYGWADEDPPRAVLRADWEGLPQDEPERPMKRGDMPAHLQNKADTQPSSKPAAKAVPKAKADS